MLHVFNPDLVASRAARPDPHGHHGHELRRIRAAERQAARQAFIKAARAFLQAGAARVRKAMGLGGRAGKAGSVVLPQPGGGAVKCEACA